MKAFAQLPSRSRLSGQHWPPACVPHRVTRQGSDKTNAVSHSVSKQAYQSACPKNAVRASCHQPPSFTQKTGVRGAARLLPEKLKTIGSKELGSQLQGTPSTRSRTCWTGTRCLQLKLRHSFEKKKQNTHLDGSDYADSTKTPCGAGHCPRADYRNVNCLASGPQAKKVLPK